MLHVNNKKHLPDFIRLNEQWIQEYFEIEDIDRKLAANPASVIENGGYVFTIANDEEVVGCCALFKGEQGEYELARMAVSPLWRGKGLGRQLIDAAINKAVENKARRVYLVSNTRLESAINLYKNSGFKTVSLAQHPVYARANIVMDFVFS